MKGHHLRITHATLKIAYVFTTYAAVHGADEVSDYLTGLGWVSRNLRNGKGLPEC